MLISLCWLLVTSAQPSDARLGLLEAMETELRRSQKELRLDDHPPPYFLSYQLKDYDQRQVNARYGALFGDDSSRDRKLYVDVRVGSYEFDNALSEEEDFNFSLKGSSFVSRKNGPVDDDPRALTTSLWLATDERYKAALLNFLKKKGQRVYSVKDPKEPPSFSKEQAERFVQEPLPFSWNHDQWVRMAKDLSGRFMSEKALIDSDVLITGDKVVRYYVSSEGSRLVTEETLYGIHLSAVARAPDGQLLDMSRDFYAPTEAGLPNAEKLEQERRSMVADLLALRSAPVIDPYTGPAILEPEAAGVLFHEVLGHRLEGDRQQAEGEGKTFVGQLGRVILPSFLTVLDDPTTRAQSGIPLNGYYRFDEEGVRAQKVTLVSGGALQGFLLSRQPVEGFVRSNGHGRSQGNRKPTARMGNLIVHSKKQMSDEQLKRALIDEAKRQGKPYGLIIRDITGGNTNTSSFGYQAFKGIPRMVYRVDVKDGKETLVRGVEIVGTPLSSMSRVMGAGKEQGVFNGFCGAESGNVPVSAVAPALLLQEIELQRTLEGKDRPPLLQPPSIHRR